MAASTGSYFDEHSAAIEERLSRDVGFFLPMLDPFYKRVYGSSGGTGNPLDIGRDMKIIKTFHGGYTGVMDQSAATSDFVLFGDTKSTPGSQALGEKLHFQELNRTWPDPTDGPNQKPYQLEIPMRASLTNLMLTLGEMQAEALPAHIKDVIAPKLKGHSRMMAHTMCNFLFLSQNDKYQLCNLGAAADGAWALEDTNTTLTLIPTNLACSRLAVGMRLNIYSSDGATQRVVSSEGTFIVIAVDALKNKVKIKHKSGAAINGISLADSDIVVFPGGKSTGGAFQGYAGLNSWIKTGDTTVASNGDTRLLGAEAGTKFIDVNVHPEFKSLGVNMNGQPLTEHILKQLTRRFHAAHNIWGHSIDTFIASDGVWLGYERQLYASETRDRTNRLSNITSGQGSSNGSLEDGINFVMDGKSYKGLTSTYVDSGTMYGTKLAGGNWKKYSPPNPAGTTKQTGEQSQYLPFLFIGAALGNPSNRILIQRTASGGGIGLPTEGAMMPGMVRHQLVPTQIAGMKITGIEEDRLYSDY